MATNQDAPQVAGAPNDTTGPCRLCSVVTKLTKTHVPPETAGNKGGLANRRVITFKNGISKPSKWRQGGMWVHGLCLECNQAAGKSDPALAGLFDYVSGNGSSQLRTGAIANAMLSGIFAITPGLASSLPSAANSVRRREPVHSLGPNYSLRLAEVTEGFANLCSSVGVIHGPALVAGNPQVDFVLGAVFFRPLAYALVPQGSMAGWVDITDWAKTDVADVNDVSTEISNLPQVRSIQHGVDIFVGHHDQTVFMEGHIIQSSATVGNSWEK